MHRKQDCLDAGWSIWIQATSDPDSRTSYYRDTQTQTLSKWLFVQKRNTHIKKMSVSETGDRGQQEVQGTDEWTSGGNWRPWWLGCRARASRLIEPPVNLRTDAVVKIYNYLSFRFQTGTAERKDCSSGGICWRTVSAFKWGLKDGKREGNTSAKVRGVINCKQIKFRPETQAYKNVNQLTNNRLLLVTNLLSSSLKNGCIYYLFQLTLSGPQQGFECENEVIGKEQCLTIQSLSEFIFGPSNLCH